MSDPLFWIVLTFGIFILTAIIQSKINNEIIKSMVNPLLMSIIIIIILLVVLDIPYEDYSRGGQYISLFVTPATVSLAIKLEKNFVHLKRNYPAILTGIVTGVLIHSALIVILGWIFRFDQAMVATLYPKSITTAIAVGVSESLGGIVSLTVAVVVFTGIVGAVIGEPLLKLFRVTDPVAQGIALGTSTHAMGTSRAIQMGEVQGAMSGLSIVVTGITVVILAPLFAPLLNLF
ncbi:LrgB family protein [Aerococcus urinae]